MRFKERRTLKKTRIEIIPMIDTMFFLLVFFMLSSLALTHMNGLPVDLPQGLPAHAQNGPGSGVYQVRNQRTPARWSVAASWSAAKAGNL